MFKQAPNTQTNTHRNKEREKERKKTLLVIYLRMINFFVSFNMSKEQEISDLLFF